MGTSLHRYPKQDLMTFLCLPCFDVRFLPDGDGVLWDGFGDEKGSGGGDGNYQLSSTNEDYKKLELRDTSLFIVVNPTGDS